MGISLCMIVKNEQDWLPGAVESVRSIVDEVIIVDTGSTDRTVAIARQHGAEVYSFEWVDDFSAARNATRRSSGSVARSPCIPNTSPSAANDGFFKSDAIVRPSSGNANATGEEWARRREMSQPDDRCGDRRVQLAQRQVGLRRGALHHPQRPDHRLGLLLPADLEVAERALGLRAPILVARHLDGAEAVRLDADLGRACRISRGHGWFSPGPEVHQYAAP